MQQLRLMAGSANRNLAEEVAKRLNVRLTPTDIRRFPDGEIYVRILESVRGADVFLIQPTCPDANLNLMELLITVDALKRSSPQKITAVIPYYGYSRQDRKNKPREPISAKLVAKMIEAAGVDRVITFDLHVEQIQGFFNIPVDNLEAVSLFADFFINKKLKDIVVVSPDVGGARRARRLAKILDLNIAIIDKRRPAHGVAEIMNVIGEVKGMNAIIINPAAYTHTSVAIRDAILSINIPVIEVHLSNIYKREEFRHHSMISDIAAGQITGFGSKGYFLALDAVKTVVGGK